MFTEFDNTLNNSNNSTTTPNKPAIDWICYLDDDMDVHVSNLIADLEQRKPRCTPNCWIADSYYNFPAGGWCMEVSLANTVGDLLEQKTDEQINWKGPDDGGFTKSVMRGVNGIQPSVTVIDSNHWISECNKPRKSALVLFCRVLWCVRLKRFHLNFLVCLCLISFATHVY